MHELNCKLKLDIEINNEHWHFSIDAERVGEEIKVSVNGGSSQISHERETLSYKKVLSLEKVLSTRPAAVVYIKEQIQVLLDRALELPPIRHSQSGRVSL